MTDERAPRVSSHLESDVKVLEVQFENAIQRLDAIDRSVSSLRDSVERKFDALLSEMKSSYATKAELEAINLKVKSLNENVGWFIKLILGTVTLALLGLIIAKGGSFHG